MALTRTRAYLAAIAALVAISVGIQVWRDRGWQPHTPPTDVMWLRAGPATGRLFLGFDALAADLYWIRAVVYFGRQRQSTDPGKNYDLLHPLLDLVTTLDPRFAVAYRFGAIFLSEPPPDGPGRPDLAVQLLQRGVDRFPEKWEYMHDIGFVYYWHHRDYERGAEWLERAAAVPGAPIWLMSTAASMHAERGDRRSARALWQQLRDAADNDYLRSAADLRLAQFDAMDVIDQLTAIVARFQRTHGRWPQRWQDLIAARLLRAIPRDAAGEPFALDPATGEVSVARQSALWPMPQGFPALPAL